MRWKDYEVQNCIDLLQNGDTYDIIAKKVNRTYGSVRGILQRMGFKYIEEQKITKSCLNCTKSFCSTRRNKKKFCSSTCSLEYNNKKRVSKTYRTFVCLNCQKEHKTYAYRKNKFCGVQCAGEYKRKLIFKKIENGDTNLHETSYRNYLIYKHGCKCMKCGWSEMNPVTGLIPIQLEHIDGNSTNNSLSNLKLLCPNCHSLTPTFGALNKGNGRKNRYKNK